MDLWIWKLMGGGLKREVGGQDGRHALVAAALCGAAVVRDLTIGQGSTLERAAKPGFCSLRYVEIIVALRPKSSYQ